MNVLRVTLLLVAMNLFAAVVLGQPSGKLAGTVSDLNEARVHGATVVVTIKGVTRTTTTNEEGAYELDLPSGIYRITVASIGFCPSRRASFRIKPSTAVTFNSLYCHARSVTTLKSWKDNTKVRRTGIGIPSTRRCFLLSRSGECHLS